MKIKKTECILGDRKWISIQSFFSLLVVSITFFGCNRGGTSMYDLTVNYAENPVGIDSENVRFSWKMESDLVGQAQIAYQINIYEENGNEVWNSGTVESGLSVAIPYDGPELSIETRYNWTVAVTCANGDQITSKPGYFETGTDFSDAEWIYYKTPAVNCFDSVMTIRLRPTIVNGGFTLYFAIKNDSTRFEWSFSENLLTAIKLNTNGSMQLDEIDLSGIVNRNVPFDLEVSITDAFISTCINNRQVSLIGQNFTVEQPYIGIMVSPAQIDRRTREVRRPAQSVKFENITLTVDDVSEDIGDPSYTLSAVTAEPAQGGFPGQGSSGAQAVTFFQSEYQGNPVEYLPESTAMPIFRKEKALKGRVSKLDFEPQLVGGNNNTAYMLEEDIVYPKESQETFIYDPENIDFSTGLAYGEVLPTVVNPAKKIRLEKGKKLVIDMGQNLAGVACIMLTGPEGTKVQMRGAEMLNDGKDNPEQESAGSCGPKGTLYWYGLTRGRESDEYWYTDTYYMSDKKEQEYRPSFTFHGFRYLEVSASDDIMIHSVYAQPITSSVTQTGFIETNNENVNRLFVNTLWNQMGNYLSIPTDYPDRSERLGWSGDVNVFSETALYNFDVVGFLDNYMEISKNYAINNGCYFGTTMPGPSRGEGSSNAGWTDAPIVLAWAMYQQTGDIAILERYYDVLSEYMALIMENGLRPGYGDWVAFQATSSIYMAVMYQAYDALLMSKIAGTLGLSNDVEKYNAEYERLMRENYAKYVDEEGNVLSVSADNVQSGGFLQPDIILDNSQTSILWALKLGLYSSEEEREVFIENLLTNIDNEGTQIRSNAAEKTLSTGFLGVNVLLPVLTENGLVNTAYDLLLQDEMPSWLYEVKLGATTTWERWNAYSAENSFGDYGMNSFNHYAYGAVGEWMFEYMTGIQKDENDPGFKNVILQPVIDSGSQYNDQLQISKVNGKYESFYGTIISNWSSDGSNLVTYETTIPANTMATLYLPLDDVFNEESVKDYENVLGITFKGITQHNGVDVAEFDLLSGGYIFEVRDGNLVIRLQKGFKTM